MREHAKFGELNDEDYDWYKELEKFFGSFGDLSDYSEEEALVKSPNVSLKLSPDFTPNKKIKSE